MKLKNLILACGACLSSLTAMAHAPFVSPSSYLVEGGNTAILAGFAEKAFDTEVAIRGFEFQVIQSNGESKNLNLVNSKTVSVADVETTQNGTYQIIGERSGNLKYVKLDQRWLRVLDAKAANVPPLKERSFAASDEVNDKSETMTVNRDDQVITYFTKGKISPIKSQSLDGLQISYSQHPNQLSVKQTLQLKLELNKKGVENYKVEVEKQQNSVLDQAFETQLKTNKKGVVELKFPSAGQYLITITSPESKLTEKPQKQNYRTIISLYVAD